MPPLITVTAASAVTRSSVARSVVAIVLALPVLLITLLVVLLGGGLAADGNALGAPTQLRPGAVADGYEPLLRRASQTCATVTAPLLAAQIEVESGWNPRAISPAGAQGLAQFMPVTWASAGVDGDGDGVRDPFNPADAIVSQASFLCKLLDLVSVERRLNR
jgi:soluble lytic murein transglycosylase-like protein